MSREKWLKDSQDKGHDTFKKADEEEKREIVINELIEKLEEVKEHLQEVVSVAKEASKMAGVLGGETDRVVAGQLENYLIPGVKGFAKGKQQIGSIESLIDFIMKLEEW